MQYLLVEVESIINVLFWHSKHLKLRKDYSLKEFTAELKHKQGHVFFGYIISSGSSAGKNTLLIRQVRGEWPDWLQLTGKQY